MSLSVPTSMPTSSAPATKRDLRFLSSHGHWLLALLPVLWLICFLFKYAVDLPFLDQWEFVPLLEKSYGGGVTFHDLWAQHNEHRLFFPRLIMLGLAHLTDWNTGYELVVNLVLAAGIFAVLGSQIRLTARTLATRELRWALPAVSLIVFSVSQYENWLWGWQMQMFLNLLCILGSISLLARSTFRWHTFIGALLLAVIANYSFANGLLIWPIGAGLLWCALRDQRERRAAVTWWSLAGALVLGSYLWHYEKPADHPRVSFVLDQPITYFSYAFKYLGNMCAQIGDDGGLRASKWAGMFGVGAISLFAWAGLRIRRSMKDGILPILPYLAMSAYSIGSALMTAAGRVGFGANQSLCSRYCTMTIPLWVSLVVMLMIIRKQNTIAGPERQSSGELAGRCGLLAKWSLAAILCLLGLSSVLAVRNAEVMSLNRVSARQYLYTLAKSPGTTVNEGELYRLYPLPKVVEKRYQVLLYHHLSLFRNWDSSQAVSAR